MRQPGCPTWSLRTRGFHSPPHPASSGQSGSTQRQTHQASQAYVSPLRRRAEPTFLSAGSLRSAGMSFQSCPSCWCTYPKGPASLPRRGRYGNPTRFPRFLSAVREALENALVLLKFSLAPAPTMSHPSTSAAVPLHPRFRLPYLE